MKCRPKYLIAAAEGMDGFQRALQYASKLSESDIHCFIDDDNIIAILIHISCASESRSVHWSST